MERRRFSQINSSRMANCFCCLSQNAMVCLCLLSRITTKLLKKLQDFFFKTKIFIFVLEAPRDQDPGLEDYITAVGTSDVNKTKFLRPRPK